MEKAENLARQAVPRVLGEELGQLVVGLADCVERTFYLLLLGALPSLAGIFDSNSLRGRN